MHTHEIFMKRCLQLAQNGLGTTYPNPLVGSVIVDNKGLIIGEGWHYQAGTPHAEVMAVRDAESKGVTHFNEATIYVNLEPCSHTGKTPPCASLLIEKGFSKVIIGTLDPHEKVAGKGVAMLEKVGIECTVGVLEKECNELNKRFFTYHKKRRPYIILKWAETADGFIAPHHKNEIAPVWITNSYSQQRSHKLRANEQAILVGGKTVLDDNPSLTCRSWYGRQPLRFVLDSKNNLDSSAAVFNDVTITQCLHFHSNQVKEIVDVLYTKGVQSIIIEGGFKTIQNFIDQSMWDEAYQFMGVEVLFHKGIAAPQLKGDYHLLNRENIQNDVLKIYKRG
ncbi:MAG: bifunctional diaminohydroxyphosphoribosylaminopyrimidine deaminase/5-amino-6-(5-phosphoribosylamino)uracil reductase RibD [Nonlabens sp.]